MFEDQYNDEMNAEIKRLEARNRAFAAGHPEWLNACVVCGSELITIANDTCCQCV